MTELNPWLVIGVILGIVTAPLVLLLWDKTIGTFLSRRQWRKWKESEGLFCDDPDIAAGVYEVERGRGSND